MAMAGVMTHCIEKETDSSVLLLCEGFHFFLGRVQYRNPHNIFQSTFTSNKAQYFIFVPHLAPCFCCQLVKKPGEVQK